MKMHCLLKWYALIALLGSNVLSLCVDIGSDTVVTRFTAKQTLNNGDRIAGFAAIDGGFEVINPFATGTFDSLFPVSGTMSLNGGTLILNQDLIFHTDAQWDKVGNIAGNHHVLEFAPGMMCVPSLDPANLDCDIFLLTTASSLNDEIQTVDFGITATGAAGGQLVAVGTNRTGGPINTLYAYTFNGTSLTFRSAVTLDTSRSINLVRWHPTKMLLAVGATSAANDDLYMYRYNNATGALTKTGGVNLSGQATAVAWHPDGDLLAIGTDVNGAEIEIYTVNTITGAINTPAFVSIASGSNRDVRQGSMDWDITGSYLAVGFDSGTELQVYQFNRTVPSLTLNASADTTPYVSSGNGSVESLDWNNTYSNIIAVGLEGTGGDLLVAFQHNPGAGTLTEAGKISGLNRTVLSLMWHSDGNCIGLGRDLTGGAGTGLFAVYEYDRTGSAFTQINSRNTTGRVNAVRFSRDNNYLLMGQSTVLSLFQNLGLYLGVDPNNIGAAINFVLGNVNMILNCSLKFRSFNMTFTGESSINGRGFSAALESGARIVVDKNSSLLLKDITIDDIGEGQLILADHSSTLSVENARFELDHNLTVSKGLIKIIDGVLSIVSDADVSFIYTSTRPFTIGEDATLLLEEGITFSYAPVSNASNLLVFEDASSELFLRGGNLAVSASQGLLLTKGHMHIDGRSYIENSASSAGVFIGDGLSAANNFCLNYSPGAHLSLMSGSLIYQNV